MRRIAHLDMDAFFASVELLRYPELVGEAVVVGGRRAHAPVTRADGRRDYARLREYTGRGVVTTSTYPARALGVFSGMGLMQSARLARADPAAGRLRGLSLLFAPFQGRRGGACADHRGPRYRRNLHRPHSACRSLAALGGASARRGLRRHRIVVFDRHRAGQAACKTLFGPRLEITVLTADEVPTRIWPLPAKRINGIGPKSNERLARLGIGNASANWRRRLWRF